MSETTDERPESTPMIEVVVGVPDVERALAFYTEALGLRHVRTVRRGHVEIIELEAGGSRVTLVPSRRPTTTLAFSTEDVKRAVKRLTRAGAKPEKPVEAQGATWVAFTDPFGTHLGLLQDDSEVED